MSLVDKVDLKGSYRLEQTVLDVSPVLSFFGTSDNLGWQNVNVSFGEGQPHDYEISHGASRDLWIATSYRPLDIFLNVDGAKQHVVCPSRGILLLAPGTPLGVRRVATTYGLHLFLKREIIDEVAGELFDDDAKHLEILSKFGFENRNVDLLLDIMKQALSEPAEHTRLKIEYVTRALAVEVLSKSVALNRSIRVPIHECLTPKQARLVVEYISEHLATEIRLNDLAALAGVSRTLFIRRFKASFRQTPHRYLMEARIRRGQGLLAKTNFPIMHVALMCGFADHSHFSTVFKRAVGVSPMNYRRCA